MKAVRILGVVVLVLMLVGLVLGTACAGSKGEQGLKGDTGATGASGLVWGTPVLYGPYSKDIGTTYGFQSIPSLNPGDRVDFSFTVAGSQVRYWVQDPNPNNNWILTGNAGNLVMSGGGSFIAASSGTYFLHFVSSGILTPSVLTIYYTVYPVG